MADWLDRRRAGVLLHISSLPGEREHGDLGDEAHHFLQFMTSCGLSVWQMLPIGPTGPDGSPYQTTSMHAGNPELISVLELERNGWLAGDVATSSRADVLRAAYEGFRRLGDRRQQAAFGHFVGIQADWLDDFALFQSLHEHYRTGWWEWPEPLRDRQSSALSDARREMAEEIARVKFQQFVFHQQFEALRRRAAELDILLFGDLPIFVALDSADVWLHQDLFDLHEDGRPRTVAGVPPDYFSATGQRWGNPLYLWNRMAATGYAFWTRRLRTQLGRFDLVRIDHFRGFADYWEIPADEPDAVNGQWRSGPGDALFEALRREFDLLPLVAEDLGLITKEVEALRQRQRLPGMRVLQFAFDGEPHNPYLPFHHDACSVAYTGTHDNDTLVGWYQKLSDNERNRVMDYLGQPAMEVPRAVCHAALMSPARLAVLPMQDLLELGSEARMNTPGTVSDSNWRWRFQWPQVPAELAARLRRQVWLTDRLGG